MSKKKPANHKSGSKLQDQPAAVLLQEAEALAAKGNYRDAIERYKILIKREPRAEWLSALAQTYLQRGHELAAKDMYKEAAVMWENRASTCGDSSEQATYLEWLLKAGRYDRAMYLYQENEAALSQTAKNLPALFGALALSNKAPGLRQELAKHPAWTAPLALAESALRAYCEGASAEALETLLKQIPFRSPFRDLRSLLKALALLDSNPAEATRLAAGIAHDSPYASLARLLPKPVRFSVLNEAGHEAVVCPRPDQEAWVAALYGWNPEQVKAFQALTLPASAGQAETGKAQAKAGAFFSQVLKHRRGLGEDYVRRLCYQWIPHLSAQALHAFERTFSVTPLEKLTLSALTLEHNREYSQALPLWEEALGLLKPQLHDPDKRLQAALIQSRRIGLLRYIDDDTLADLEAPLQQCIKWQPEDKSHWLQLIALYRDAPDSKKAYAEWADKAVVQFPKEVDVLLTAVEAANQRKSFKKAAGYAQAVLKIDSVNAKARAVLIESHLGHARKQFKAGKYEAVTKELNHAAQYERVAAPNPVLRINQACLAYLQGEHKRASVLLEEALRAAGSVVGGHALIFLESQQVGIEPGKLSGAFGRKATALLPGWDKKYLPPPKELARLPRLLEPYQEQRAFTNLLRLWDSWLKKAADQAFESDDLIGLCEFFKKCKEYRLLVQYAHHGIQRRPDLPLLVYYECYGGVGGDNRWLPGIMENRLEQALEQAKAQGDERTRRLLIHFLSERPIRSPFFMEDDDEENEDENEGEDSKALRNSLDERMAKFQALPEAEQVRRVFNGRMPSPQELEELGREGFLRKIFEYLMRGDGEGDEGDSPFPFPFPFPLPSKPRRK